MATRKKGAMGGRAQHPVRESTAAVAIAAEMTANQIVAYNLTRARLLRGWTQDQTTAELEPYLGKRWSKASMSQAERSVAGKVTRTFDANELLAFARTFRLPVTWFLLPPAPGEAIEDDQALDPGKAGELVDLVLGDDGAAEALSSRVADLLADLPPERLSTSQQHLRALAQARIDTVTESAHRSLEDLEAQVAKIAETLASITARARQHLDRTTQPAACKQAAAKQGKGEPNPTPRAR